MILIEKKTPQFQNVNIFTWRVLYNKTNYMDIVEFVALETHYKVLCEQNVFILLSSIPKGVMARPC